MTYQINTVEELQALPFGAMVETAEGKHTKTSDADEWDFMHDSAEVLAEGNVIAFTTGSGVAKPKPTPTPQEQYETEHAQENYEQPPQPPQSLSVTGDEAKNAGAPSNEAMDAMAAFEKALGDVTKKVSKPSQFDDDEHDHDHGGPEVGWIVSVINMNLSVVPVASWAMPGEELAQMIAKVLNDVLSKVSTETFYVGASPVLGFHTIPMIDLGEAMAIDLGHIVQALVGDEPGVEERLQAAMEEQAERNKPIREMFERKMAEQAQAPEPGEKSWLAWESKPTEAPAEPEQP